MLNRSWQTVRRYPLVVATVVVGIVGGVLSLSGAREVVPWVLGGFAVVVVALSATQMVRDLLRGHTGLDILAVTAITAAIAVGEFWAALVVVLMLTGGEALEDYATQRSWRELSALLRRTPQTAHRVVGDGTEDVVADDIAIGDIIVVLPGELVPVDGVLAQEASFDESSVTGESLPVERAVGERVRSGVVNGHAAVHMTAVASAADSQYQQIVRMVAEAQESRSRTVRLADRFALPFTVLALIIAGVAWYVSGEAVRFAEVLVVATPCPLLIAAPVAFMSGMSRSANNGVLVKGGVVLEQLSRVKTAAFDKTGTLTEGSPQMDYVRAHDGHTHDGVLQYAAAAEVYSSHVLAESVVNAAKHRGLPILAASHAEEYATNGVEAQVDGRRVRVGKASWVASDDHAWGDLDLAVGQVAAFVAFDGHPAGVIVMRDRLRTSAADTLAELRELSVHKLVMLTGDTHAAAASIASQADISEFHAACTPETKVETIRGLEPRPVMMVGDGLNDAPVLAAADVGIAMGARGSTAAGESADAVNLIDDLHQIPLAVRIGKDTTRIALDSIWLGIIISLGLMVVASMGYLPAIIGAWLQEVVDLIAILTALRALRGRRRTNMPPQPKQRPNSNATSSSARG